MTLRTRLAMALAAAALLPMVAAVALPLSRVEGAARSETDRRIAAARRQAELVIARERAETSARLDRAARGLASDPKALDAVLRGPDAAARGVARMLAEQYGLDVAEVLGASGAVLSAAGSSSEPGHTSRMTGLPAVGIALVPLAQFVGGRSEPAGLLAARRVAVTGEALWIAGGRAAGRALMAEISSLTGEPAALVDPQGRVVVAAGGEVGSASAEGMATLDGGWAVKVAAPSASVEQMRSDLIAGALGVAPLAVVAAIAAGFFIAGRIVRPVAALAERADAIAAARGGPLTVPPADDEVTRLEASFDRMLDALQHSETRRASAERIAAWQEIARRVAHEVRNALAPIQIAVANLRRTREKAPAEIDRSLAEEGAAILEEVESLKRLVDEFSDFARLPASRPIPCDLAAVIRQAAGLFAGRIASSGTELQLRLDEGAGNAVADPEQIGRVLKNVIANALDALESLEPGRPRRLEIGLHRAEGTRDALAITVRDSGNGIAPAAMTRCFEPYYTTREAVGGTGLGLAIAHRIVTEHGGTIRVESTAGRGAVSSIVIPAAGPSTVRT